MIVMEAYDYVVVVLFGEDTTKIIIIVMYHLVSRAAGSDNAVSELRSMFFRIRSFFCEACVARSSLFRFVLTGVMVSLDEYVS
jgi:hypothetical protein